MVTFMPNVVVLGKSGVVFAVKLYPAGATTNSQDGVTDVEKCLPVLEEMARQEMPLLVSSFGALLTF
jgi:dihydroorotase